MQAQGSVHQRCGCRNLNGRELGSRCPKFSDPEHGSWYLTLDMPTAATASRERIRRGGYTSRDSAEQALAALREPAFKQGALITVESWLARWLESQIQLRDSTLRSYTQLSRNHLVPHLGYVTLRELQPRQITVMLDAVHRFSIAIDP